MYTLPTPKVGASLCCGNVKVKRSAVPATNTAEWRLLLKLPF